MIFSRTARTMKSSGLLRSTLLVLALGGTIPAAAIGQTPSEHSLVAFGGQLVGRSKGEWGGSLHFQCGDGCAQRLLEENVVGMHKMGRSVVVFTGLAHLTSNDGAIYVVRRKNQRELSVSVLHRLSGEPSETIRIEGGSIRFRVFTGQLIEEERPQGQTYKVTTKAFRCQVLDTTLALRSVPCAAGAP